MSRQSPPKPGSFSITACVRFRVLGHWYAMTSMGISASQSSRKLKKRMGTSVNGSINSLTRCRYGAIYADPPWSFRNWSAKGTGRNAVSHYDCLNFETLAALPIAELAADDCALFLWAVDPLLDKALELIR